MANRNQLSNSLSYIEDGIIRPTDLGFPLFSFQHRFPLYFLSSRRESNKYHNLHQPVFGWGGIVACKLYIYELAYWDYNEDCVFPCGQDKMPLILLLLPHSRVFPYSKQSSGCDKPLSSIYDWHFEVLQRFYHKLGRLLADKLPYAGIAYCNIPDCQLPSEGEKVWLLLPCHNTYKLYPSSSSIKIISPLGSRSKWM